MAKLIDNGTRHEFATGALREVLEEKGRCDLLPLDVIGDLLCQDQVLANVHMYMKTGYTAFLQHVIESFKCKRGWDNSTMILEVSKHYEDGARKYGDRNWEKGLPLHSFIDSGIRHYLKYLRGDTDEPHDRAFVWNMIGAIWTHENIPEMIDLPFIKTERFKEEHIIDKEPNI